MGAHGYIVVCCDGRGTGYMGEKFKKQTYGNLGALEVEDQISFARYQKPVEEMKELYNTREIEK
mgnify:CR=1 FL=1